MNEKDAIITYERLYELLRLEKYNKELQTLDNDFFDHVTKYLLEKKTTLTSQEHKDSIFAAQSIQKTQKQLENIRRIIQDLYERRESKIIQLALFNSRTEANSQDADAMLAEEKELYSRLVTDLNTYRADILHSLLEGKKPEIPKTKSIKNGEKSPDKKVVKFLEAIPQFVGEDLQVYGPYNPADVVTLPAKVSDLLIKNKRVEEL